MKYAFMTFSTPQLTLAENLSLAKRLGYQGIEPRITGGHKHGIELDTTIDSRREIFEQAQETGISLVCLATSCRLANRDTAKENIEMARRAIDLAGDICTPCIRVFGGGFPDSVSREDAADFLVESLSSLANQAQERAVAVCFETHDVWCDPNQVAEVLRRVNHPAICVNWDILHPVRMGLATVDESFEAIKPWISHVHFHDGLMGEPIHYRAIGEGVIDHRRTLELLTEINYNGFLSGEWIDWEPYEQHLPRELSTMKRLEREISAG